ncbi:MAG: 3-hydroxyacyl-ACP dehydratase FabZ [Gammaproteobacteria bacterium]|nr:3-hydroxyacyl-ACP dehydratase FabZ [Gammaproteobacteria bacterium]
MNIEAILKSLPHRYPFILIDRVLSIEIGQSITALKNVTINEQFFVGHFPGRPIMPGVLILEALAQAGGILAHKSTEALNLPAGLWLFAGIDNARFKQIVEPGDQLILTLTVIRSKREFWKLHGEASVNGQLACSADLMSIRKELS